MKKIVSLLVLCIVFYCGSVFAMKRIELPHDTPDRILIRNPDSHVCFNGKIGKHKRDLQDLRRTVLKKRHNNKIAGFGTFFTQKVNDMIVTGRKAIILQRPIPERKKIIKKETNYIAAIMNYGLELLSNMPTENDIGSSYLMHEITD